LLRRFVEDITGYWFYKKKYLPIGADLRVDLNRIGIHPQIIFDVGANVGQTYKKFRSDFPHARVYCFEPVTNTFAQLRQIVSDPDVAEQIAFGDYEGEAVIHTHPQWHVLNSIRVAVGPESETIRMSRVDMYGVVPDLLKIDTEGFEIPVLRGAAKTLDRIKAVFVEVGFDRANERNTYFSDVAEFLQGHCFYGLYDVTHYPRRDQPSFANALFVHRSIVSENAR
jgi:FkbM family methyltransferase